MTKDLRAHFNMMFKSQELCHHEPFDGRRKKRDFAARHDARIVVDGVINQLKNLNKTADFFTWAEFADLKEAVQIASARLWDICAPPGVEVTAELLNSMPD